MGRGRVGSNQQLVMLRCKWRFTAARASLLCDFGKLRLTFGRYLCRLQRTEMMMIRTLNRRQSPNRNARAAALAAVALVLPMCLPATDAFAVSARVKFACARDYYAHCSKFAPDSPETRRCMRSAGDSLSPRCVNALVAEGEVSTKEVTERVASRRGDN
jgi:hypothetical protein